MIAADPQRDLVFLPTSSAAPDYYGALRPRRQPLRELDRRAARIDGRGRVALPDGPSRPLGLRQRLSTRARERDARRQDDSSRRAGDQDRTTVRAASRDRRTDLSGGGTQSSAASTIPGEEASPTQPFTTLTPPLSPHAFTADQAFGINTRGSGRVQAGDRGIAQRRHLHATQPRRHAGHAVEHRRRALGRRGRRRRDRASSSCP